MKTIIKWSLISFTALLVACGGSDDAATEAQTSDEQLKDDLGDTAKSDTASDVVTTLADVNGFKITTDTLNPHGYDINGTVVNITAFVKDHSNNPVEDGTVVTFIADDNGLVEDQCATTNGTCSVKWISSRDRNYDGDYLITIMARTIGEDSFIDKNANSKFDANETFFTQSEAFLDANDDGDYDSGFNDYDEYSDYNSNGSFDSANSTIYKGDSCTDTAKSLGHCTTRIEIWDTIKLVNSAGGAKYNADGDKISNAVNISFTDCEGNTVTSITNLTTTEEYCVEFKDSNGNVPPVGTKVEVTTDNGTIVSKPDATIANMFVTIGSGDTDKLKIKTDGEPSIGDLVIKTTSTAGLINSLTIPVSDNL